MTLSLQIRCRESKQTNKVLFKVAELIKSGLKLSEWLQSLLTIILYSNLFSRWCYLCEWMWLWIFSVHFRRKKDTPWNCIISYLYHCTVLLIFISVQKSVLRYCNWSISVFGFPHLILFCINNSIYLNSTSYISYACRYPLNIEFLSSSLLLDI